MLHGTPTGIYKSPSGPKSIYLYPCQVSDGKSSINTSFSGSSPGFCNQLSILLIIHILSISEKSSLASSSLPSSSLP